MLCSLVPDTYEKLQAMLDAESPERQAVILERMIKCNHPSLGEGFKNKLIKLFGFLLQHLQDTAVSTEVCDCLSSEFLVFHSYKAS
jgi:nucleolar protein 14